jgi:hypothetical protein
MAECPQVAFRSTASWGGGNRYTDSKVISYKPILIISKYGKYAKNGNFIWEKNSK